MLRESMQTEGKQVEARGVTQGFDSDPDIAHAAALIDFAEAVVLRDAPRAAATCPSCVSRPASTSSTG